MRSLILVVAIFWLIVACTVVYITGDENRVEVKDKLKAKIESPL